MTEQWRDIAEFDCAYQVSNLGRVRRAIGDAGIGRNTTPGKILVTRLDCNGYPRALLYDRIKRKYRSIGVATAVLEAFIGMRPDGTEASHLNGVRADPRLENLCWESRSGNHLRKRAHGTMICGEKQHGAKLRAVDIPTIRSRIENETHEKVGKDYGVSREAITNIARGKTWAHIA
jgi:hypothetical protein